MTKSWGLPRDISPFSRAGASPLHWVERAVPCKLGFRESGNRLRRRPTRKRLRVRPQDGVFEYDHSESVRAAIVACFAFRRWQANHKCENPEAPLHWWSVQSLARLVFGRRETDCGVAQRARDCAFHLRTAQSRSRVRLSGVVPVAGRLSRGEFSGW